MSENPSQSEIRHVYKQMKAVCSLIQPEYQTAFHKLTKVLELQLLLQEFTPKGTQTFHASSISASEEGGEPKHIPFDLTAFIRALTPVCSEKERSFLHTLQNTEQTLRMFEQVKQFQTFSKDMTTDELMMQFLTPEQQKIFQQFQNH